MLFRNATKYWLDFVAEKLTARSEGFAAFSTPQIISVGSEHFRVLSATPQSIINGVDE
jgi:hypothetical protein